MNEGLKRLRPGSLAAFAISCVAAAVVLGPGLRYPLAFAGAQGAPNAWLANTLLFVLPGATMAVAALWTLMRAPGAANATRIGWMLWLLAALGWVAMGLWHLDPYDLDGTGSQGHAAAWMVWSIAVVAGGVAQWQRDLAPRAIAITCLLFGWATATWWPPGVAQLLAPLPWFTWPWWQPARARA